MMNKSNCVLVGYVAVALFLSISTVYYLFLCYHMGPFRDMWIAMDFIRSFFEGNGHLADFFSLHGGAHRLAIPRIFFLIEYGLFSGSNVFLMVSAILIQVSVVILIWQQLRPEMHVSPRYRWFLVAMTLILMFNATQLENFIYTFDIQWFLTSASAAWALAFWVDALVGYTEKKNFKRVSTVLAVSLTVVSIFSSFSGLCLLFVLPLLTLVYRVPKKIILNVVFITVVIIILYLQGPFAEGGHWGAKNQVVTTAAFMQFVFTVLLVWLKWTALYLGSPLGRSYFWAGALFAYASLGFLMWHWIRALKNGIEQFTPFQLFCLSMALFAAIVGIVTGLGRMYFVNTADEDRYQSIVAIYWLAIFAFALSSALKRKQLERGKYHVHGVLGLIVFWTCWVIPNASIKDARAQVNFFNRVNNANLAIATGQWDYDEIKDTLILGDKWKKENRPERHAGFLHERGWGIFASSDVRLLGRTLDLTLVSADACEGDISSVNVVKAPYRGLRLNGNGYDVINETVLTKYLVINDNGQVIGLGRLQRQKNSLLPITWQSPEQAQWLAYTVDIDAPTDVRVLGERGSGGYCVVASAKLLRPDS